MLDVRERESNDKVCAEFGEGLGDGVIVNENDGRR